MPAKIKLNIEQGATFRYSLNWTAEDVPVDLTGCTARMQIRLDVGSPVVIAELLTQNAGIVLNTTPGQVDLYISATNTAAFNFDTAVYDLEIMFSSGDVCRLIEGEVVLSLEVTRDE